MPKHINVRQLDSGSRVSYLDERARRGRGPVVTGTVTRVHYSRQAADIHDDRGYFHECVSVENLRHLEPEVHRYGRSGTAATPEARYGESDEVLYRGYPARVLRRYRGGAGWAYDLVCLFGIGRDTILAGVDEEQIRPAAEGGGRSKEGLGAEERREFARYCRDRDITDPIAAAQALGEFRRGRGRG